MPPRGPGASLPAHNPQTTGANAGRGDVLDRRVILLATAAILAPAAAYAEQAEPAPAPPPAEKKAESAEDATEVRGVTVTSQRDGLRVDIDRRSYSVANDLQATTGSISDALRNIPSVEVDVQGNVSLRGDSNVTILIDGKPSALFSGENRGDALQQLPADQIERVEVMTNPSAAYSPEGTAGIINLVTKKTRRATRSATVRANVGTDGRYNGGISGSATRGKATFAGDIGVRHDTREFAVDSERSRYDSVTDQWVDSFLSADAKGEGDSVNARGAVDYDLDDRTRLSAELRGAQFSFRSESEEAFLSTPLAYGRFADSEFTHRNGSGSLRFRRQFEGSEHDLSGDLTFEHFEVEREMEAVIDFAAPVRPSEFEGIGGRTERDLWRLKLDYNRPVGEAAKLKLGTEIETAESRYDNYGERGPIGGPIVADPALTNLFLYDQDIAAAYVTFQRPFGDAVTAQFGLRAEAVRIDINQVTSGIVEDNDYTGLYPSLHLSWDVAENQQLTASYSRRIQRPGPQDLNPYVVYIDPQNLRSGNPDLDPQITDSFEAGWQHRKGQTYYLATVYYREARDGVTDVVQDLGGGVFLTTRENLARSRSGGLELVANGRLTSTLTYSLNGNLFWNEIDASGLTFGRDREGTSLRASGSLNWQVTPNDFLQLSGFVRGETITPQGYMEPGGMLNLGYRHKFSDKLSFVLTAQDLFGTLGMEQVIDTPVLRERTEREFNARALYVGLTWTFGAPRRQPERFDFDTSGGPPG